MRSATVSRSVFVLALASACSSSSLGQSSDPSTAADLPCEVRAVFEKNCQGCHGKPAKYGAPMALTSWSDTDEGSKTEPGKKVWQRVGERIHDAARPMPPTGKLPAAELATLDSWIANGGPPGSAQCAGPDAGTVQPTSVEAELPCPANEQTTFLAHGAGADAPFEVAEDAGNLTMCFTYEVPWAGGSQATAFAPLIDDERVVHHWILFETATPQVAGGAAPCNMPRDASFLTGWAPGGVARALPPDVGLALPAPGHWLILQVHYWNVARHKDAKDRSGVRMCSTTTPRPHTAVISTIGSLAIDLPPRSTNVAITGDCTPQITEPLHIMGSGPHMHRLGKTFKTEVLRGGTAVDPVPLVDVPSWNFDLQAGYSSDLVIQPGDKIRTTCTYDNPTDKRVTFGERTENEMCFNFVAVWPAPGIVNRAGAGVKRCIE